MEVKKFVFYVLFFTNAINSAEEDNSDKKKFSISTVKENVLINKNNWNTKKWGSIYFLFPHVSGCNICDKIPDKRSIFGNLQNEWGILFNFLLSGVIEYKYMFHKKCGINISLNLNNIKNFYGKVYSIQKQDGEKEKIKNKYKVFSSYFSLDFSLEWIYKRKGKKIYSGSFCPISIPKLKVNDPGYKNYDYLFWGFTLLKFEYNRCFYLNWGQTKYRWSVFWDKKMNDKKWEDMVTGITDFLSIEFGLNIVGVNDWRKKEKGKILCRKN